MGGAALGAAWACGVIGVGQVRNGSWSGRGHIVALVTEFRRAVAAERRYEELKRLGTLAGDGGSRATAAGLVFEEFYASGGAGAAPS